MTRDSKSESRSALAKFIASLGFIASLSAAGSFAWGGECAHNPVTPLNTTVIQKAFEARFCPLQRGRSASAHVTSSSGASGTSPCPSKWKYFSDLASRLSQDKRIPDVATEAYLLTTVWLETGTFNPGTVEVIGKAQANRSYVAAKKYGRGYVQLTGEKYVTLAKALNMPALAKNIDLATDRDIAYEILVVSTRDGLLENFRDDNSGNCQSGCRNRIRISDFINSKSSDYAHARAVINANCIPSAGKTKKGCYQPFEDKGFIPPPANLDAAERHPVEQADFFEELLCDGMKNGIN
jgi:hypothetical protein